MANNSVRYPPELRERAVRMVLEATREGVYSSEWVAICAVAQMLILPRKRSASGFGEPRHKFRDHPMITGDGSWSWSGRTGSFDERTRS